MYPYPTNQPTDNQGYPVPPPPGGAQPYPESYPAPGSQMHPYNGAPPQPYDASYPGASHGDYPGAASAYPAPEGGAPVADGPDGERGIVSKAVFAGAAYLAYRKIKKYHKKKNKQPFNGFPGNRSVDGAEDGEEYSSGEEEEGEDEMQQPNNGGPHYPGMYQPPHDPMQPYPMQPQAYPAPPAPYNNGPPSYY